MRIPSAQAVGEQRLDHVPDKKEVPVMHGNYAN
jgi:hypothetical protein